jgi:DNA-binding NtrC family response regulator
VESELASALIVDPDITAAAALAQGLQLLALRFDRLRVTVHSDFSSARAQLCARPPDLLVTTLQLGEYNGLHLVHLAAATGLPTRSLVYTDMVDPSQAREIQKSGAFYEVRARLPVTLLAYVRAALPASDRRNGIAFDRRHPARGGRRAADQLPTRQTPETLGVSLRRPSI